MLMCDSMLLRHGRAFQLEAGYLEHQWPLWIGAECDALAPADAYLVALTRSGGIVAGVCLILILSVVVFPKSASHQARACTLSCTPCASKCPPIQPMT